MNRRRASAASDPGQITLSEEYLERLAPELFATRRSQVYHDIISETGQTPAENLADLKEHLYHGDSRAAMVMQTRPLLVAAYTDELDCVALLKFPRHLVDEFELDIGTRLLTVNTYHRLDRDGIAPDLTPGPKKYNRFGNFVPIIADFLSEDIERIGLRKLEISEDEWARVESLGRAFLNNKHLTSRSGHVLECMTPRRPPARARKAQSTHEQFTHIIFGTAFLTLFAGVLVGPLTSFQTSPKLLFILGAVLVVLGYVLKSQKS